MLRARAVRFVSSASIAVLVSALVGTPRVAHAQDPPSVAETPIVPPRPLAPIEAAYPEGEEGDAYVVVAVTVAVDGTVQNARVVEGVEPFAGRALESMSAVRFVPATRGGAPIAATIRFRIDFAKAARPPEPAPAPAPAPAPEPEPEPGARAGARACTARRGARPRWKRSRRRPDRRLARARRGPPAPGRVRRSVPRDRGRARSHPIVSGLPYFYVRGAPPGNVGYYFDGVRVPYLFHFGLGPSVIQPALVARTDIHKGGYPAALRSMGGRRGRLHGDASVRPRSTAKASLRVIDAGGLVEAPFAGGRGTALAGGRYSYTSALFSLLDASTSLDYRDYQSRVSYAVTDRDVLSLLVFGAYDRATQRTTPDRDTIDAATGNKPRPDAVHEIEVVLFASEFHRADARWDHSLGGGGTMRVAATLGYERTRVEARRAAEDLMTATRLEIVQPVSSSLTVRAGADLVIDRYQADSLPTFADDDDVVARQRRIFASRTDFATGIRADAVIVLDPRMEVTPGVRLDIYGSDQARAIGIDPRIAARFAVSDKVRIVHAYGLATQPPSPPIALPAVSIARLEGGLQRSAQTSAGVEIDLPSDVTTTATVFHQAFYDLNDALGTAQVQIIDIEKSDSLLGKSRGSAYGLELGLRRKLTRTIGGLLAYTLSRSERTAEGRTFLSTYDRPHVLNAALSFDLGKRMAARVASSSTTPAGQPLLRRLHFQGRWWRPAVAHTRLLAHRRTREKRWRVGRNGYLAIVLEALNATLSTETTGYQCGTQLAVPGVQREAPRCVGRIFGPVTVPSVGMEGGF